VVSAAVSFMVAMAADFMITMAADFMIAIATSTASDFLAEGSTRMTTMTTTPTIRMTTTTTPPIRTAIAIHTIGAGFRIGDFRIGDKPTRLRQWRLLRRSATRAHHAWLAPAPHSGVRLMDRSASTLSDCRVGKA
jgi:hypothetical protein